MQSASVPLCARCATDSDVIAGIEVLGSEWDTEVRPAIAGGAPSEYVDVAETATPEAQASGSSGRAAPPPRMSKAWRSATRPPGFDGMIDFKHHRSHYLRADGRVLVAHD